jgi:hypothetical protein
MPATNAGGPPAGKPFGEPRAFDVVWAVVLVKVN